jgi:hypothetical protein
MARLVEHYLDIARQDKRRGYPPPLVQRFAAHLDPACAQLFYGRGDVIAHERKLMTDAGLERWTFRGVYCEFRRRQSEDEPSLSCIDMLEAEDVSQNVAQSFRFPGVEQDMNTCDCHSAKL